MATGRRRLAARSYSDNKGFTWGLSYECSWCAREFYKHKNPKFLVMNHIRSDETFQTTRLTSAELEEIHNHLEKTSFDFRWARPPLLKSQVA
jgi:hypothetical protein